MNVTSTARGHGTLRTAGHAVGEAQLVALRCRDPAACCYETLTGSFRRADPFTEVTKPSEAL